MKVSSVDVPTAVENAAAPTIAFAGLATRLREVEAKQQRERLPLLCVADLMAHL